MQAAGVSERALRDWFSRQLITDAGIRNSLLRNEETRRTGGLPNVAVDRLARHYLVRTELRAGGAWVELVHDRFVEPILDANFDWIQRQSPLLRAAQEWQDNGRQPERLLLAPQLAVLAAEIAAAPQDPLVAEFVAASAAAAKAEADRLAAIQREQELAQAQLLARCVPRAPGGGSQTGRRTGAGRAPAAPAVGRDCLHGLPGGGGGHRCRHGGVRG